jgi:hypothetical protein
MKALNALASTTAAVAFCGVMLYPGPTRAVGPALLPLVMEAVLVNGTYVALPSTLVTGGAVATSALWTGVVASIGAGVAYFNVKETGGNTALRIPVASAPPAPAASGTSSPTGGANPSVYAYVDSSPSAVGADAPAACAAWATNAGPPWQSTYEAMGYTGHWCHFHQGGSPISGSAINVSQTCASPVSSQATTFCATPTGGSCPAGYSGPSGGVCTLTNARLATADAKVDVQRSGTTYTHISSDADYGLAGQISGSVSGDTIRVVGQDAQGNPISYEIRATSSGTTVQQQVQTQTSMGDSTVTTKTLQLNPSGEPVSTTQTTSTGTITLDPSTHTVTQSSGSTAAAESPCVTGQVGQRNCEETQTAIKKALTEKDDKDKPKDSAEKSTGQFEALLPWLGLNGWALPAHSSTCPTMAMDLSGFESSWGTVAVDGHCSIMEGQRDAVQPWMRLVWVLVALFVVLAA